MGSQFCDKCEPHGRVIWFKTKNHYLDLREEQFIQFVRELEKHNLIAEYTDDKTIEIVNPKDKTQIRLNCHECGPEIILGFLEELVKAGIIAIILDTLKKLIMKKSKELNEAPVYQVYVIQEFNRLEINSFDEKTILTALKKRNTLKRNGNPNKQIRPKQK